MDWWIGELGGPVNFLGKPIKNDRRVRESVHGTFHGMFMEYLIENEGKKTVI